MQLYEDAYFEFFRKNPENAHWLTSNFRDVYDHSHSNVESGLDYSKQEDLSKGRHIHDIAIRNALDRLGYTFQGSELLKVRGKWDKNEEIHPGFEFSPGEVPFHIPRFLNGAPFAGNQWWSPGTIEDFYQRSRILVVKEFNDDTLHPSNQQESQVHRSYPQRLAARSLLRMLPMFVSPSVSLSSVSTLPWMLDHNALPLYDRGIPRPLNSDEMCDVLDAGLQKLQGLFENHSNNDSKNQFLLGNWVGFRFAADYLEGAKTCIRSRVAALSEREKELFPEFQQLPYWRGLLPLFWNELVEQGKHPLFLARDGLVIMEYLSYRQELLASDRFNPQTTLHRTLYLPGSTTEKNTKNLRSAHPLLGETITILFGFLLDAYEENSLTRAPSTEHERKAVQATFRPKIIAQFDESRNSNEYRDGISIYAWREEIAEGISSQFGGSLSNVVVVDSDGTGKTAVFVQTLLEYFAKQKGTQCDVGVLLGGFKANISASRTSPKNTTRHSAPLALRAASARSLFRMFAGPWYFAPSRAPQSSKHSRNRLLLSRSCTARCSSTTGPLKTLTAHSRSLVRLYCVTSPLAALSYTGMMETSPPSDRTKISVNLPNCGLQETPHVRTVITQWKLSVGPVLVAIGINVCETSPKGDPARRRT